MTAIDFPGELNRSPNPGPAVTSPVDLKHSYLIFLGKEMKYFV